MAGQSWNPIGVVGVTAPTVPVRGLSRRRPWAGSVSVRRWFRHGRWTARTPKPSAHGRIADGGRPKSRLEIHNSSSAAQDSDRRIGL